MKHTKVSKNVMSVIIIAGCAVLIGAGTIVYKVNKAKQAEEAQKAWDALKPNDIIENMPDSMLSQKTMNMKFNYNGIPVSMDTTASYDSENDATYDSGRYAVKSKGINNFIEQYTEQIENITTIYTDDPLDSGTWIKECVTDAYEPMYNVPKMLDNAEIDKSDSTLSYYLLSGTITKDQFSKLFYNYFGEESTACTVEMAVDKSSGYITAIEFQSKDGESSPFDSFDCQIRYASSDDDDDDSGIDIKDSARDGEAGNAALFSLIKSEFAK